MPRKGLPWGWIIGGAVVVGGVLLLTRKGGGSITLAPEDKDRTKNVLRFKPIIEQEASRYDWPEGFDPVVFGLATIDHESGGVTPITSKPNKNGSRDYGPWQHNSKYLKKRGLDKDTAQDPGKSTEAGVKLMHDLVMSYGGRYSDVASAYNGGHPNKDNQAYTDRTLELIPRYEALV